MIPTYENMAKQAVVRVFNAIMTRAGITLIVTVAFSISSMFYNISTDYPFFMVAFLQIICFAGIYMKLGELMSMFSLNANDSQQIGRRIFRRPMVFMRHRARRMERRLARAVGTGSMVGAGAGAVAGSAYNHSRSTHKNTPARPQRNNEISMGSRVGSAVGAVMDTKNKVRDSASSLKENVKDLPTQAGYAVHSAKQKAKDNVSDFKRGVVEERENRQEQRTQKRNQHRENISQKKQELQKAQEARQTVHANGSATAGATRSHERPVATPVPKSAQTDTVTKPDMKRPVTSSVIKNAEVKAGKENVRTNIRQEQQVKSVARTNQSNVAESRSNQKKTTVQKQVNQKQNRKTVTKQPEKGRKNEIKAYPYRRYDIPSPFLPRPLFGILISGEDDDSSNSYSPVYSGMNLSADVLKHQPMVEKYARENGISEYVNVLLAIIQVESGGTATDVMQSSESLGLPPNSLSTEESIKQGCKYFASLLSSCKAKDMTDINVVIQSYNYGGGYADYVAKNGKKHSFNLAENFAKNKSGGTKVTYTNPIAVSKMVAGVITTGICSMWSWSTNI